MKIMTTQENYDHIRNRMLADAMNFVQFAMNNKKWKCVKVFDEYDAWSAPDSSNLCYKEVKGNWRNKNKKGYSFFEKNGPEHTYQHNIDFLHKGIKDKGSFQDSSYLDFRSKGQNLIYCVLTEYSQYEPNDIRNYTNLAITDLVGKNEQYDSEQLQLMLDANEIPAQNIDVVREIIDSRKQARPIVGRAILYNNPPF